MTLNISNFIPVSLVGIDKYIEVTDGHFHSKTNRRSSNKMRDNNGKPLIAVLYNVLLAPDLCGRLFSIITLMNSRQTFTFTKGFFAVFFGDNEQNRVTFSYSAQKKQAFLTVFRSLFNFG